MCVRLRVHVRMVCAGVGVVAGADVGPCSWLGLQEMKEAVELPLTHPELYEDIGIRPPKVICRLEGDTPCE